MWYGISLLFRSFHAKPREDDLLLWEERIIVIKAPSQDDAERLAREFALKQEIEYEVLGGDTLTWVFDSVFDVCEIEGDIVDSGTEVFSQYMKESEVRSLQSRF